MRRMIAASVARRIALKKLAASAVAPDAPIKVLAGVDATAAAQPEHKKRRDSARR